jgi:2-iminobutanoate/2-iminopropanoate deaminase
MLAGNTVKEPTRQVRHDLMDVIVEARTIPEKILKVTVYLEDIAMYADFNEVYLEYFNDPATRPARVCLAADALPHGALVEVECIVVV